MENRQKEILCLKFQEGQGHTLHDAGGRLPAADIQYRFRNARYIPSRDPSWRSCGIHGSALLFDGNSTCISYPPEICLRGPSLTLSAWIAPRSFPCGDPEAAEGDLKGITAVLGQVDPDAARGILLGYEAFGRPCLQIGTGNRRHTLRAGTARLVSGRWNHLAGVWDEAHASLALYVNGYPAGTLVLPRGTRFSPAEGHALMIGKNEGGKRISAGMMDMFCGLMGEIRIEAAALSPEEIAARTSLPCPDIPWEDIGPEDILHEDPYRTQFHGQPRQHWMNEPHAPLYFRGNYHLFFQSNNIGSYWGNIAWGHLVSRDTVSWRQVPDAIVPTERSVTPDGVWTGGAALDKNGLPVLFFTAADLTYAAHGLISNQNIGAAWPKDPEDPDLREWHLLPRLAVAQQPGMGRPGEFRDPHVWREEDGWYMAVCGGNLRTGGGAVHLFRTERLEVLPRGGIDMDWQYLGIAFDMDDQPPVYGTSWELPVLMPAENRAGSIRKYFLFLMPAPPDRADNKVYYYVGFFDRKAGKFIPDPDFGAEPRLLDYGDNIFTGPSVLKDPVTGRLCLFCIMQDKRHPAEEAEAGWAHCVGLTRNLWLSDDGTDLCVEADPRLESLFGEQLADLTDVSLEEANQVLAGIRESMYCLRAEVASPEAFSLHLGAPDAGSGDVYRYDPVTHTLSGRPACPGAFGRREPMAGLLSPASAPDGCLTLDLYADHSLIEGFFNGDKALSLRSYRPDGARGIRFEGEKGVRIRRLRLWRMRPAWN